jgi:glucose-1-phosphate cytidylyltransferase
MKVVILAGGYGTRLAEYTHSIPKPMVEVGNRPIIWHILKTYSCFNFKDFYIALGYKGTEIKKYFLNYKSLSSNLSVNLFDGSVNFIDSSDNLNWNINLIDTGLNTMTGGRLKRLAKYLGNETFLMTYGDGLSNIDLKKLIEFHKKNGKLITVTAVRPKAKYGEIQINEDLVESFQEKPHLQKGWINGGFFVIEPKFLNYIDDDETILEREPIDRAVRENELAAFKHEGFWQCMDNTRDRDILEELSKNKIPPWFDF